MKMCGKNSIKYAYIINKMSTDISVESYRIRQEFKFPSGKVLILMSRGKDEYSWQFESNNTV